MGAGPQNHGKHFMTMAVFVWTFKNEQGVFRLVVSHKAFREDTCVHTAGARVLESWKFLNLSFFKKISVMI